MSLVRYDKKKYSCLEKLAEYCCIQKWLSIARCSLSARVLQLMYYYSALRHFAFCHVHRVCNLTSTVKVLNIVDIFSMLSMFGCLSNLPSVTGIRLQLRGVAVFFVCCFSRSYSVTRFCDFFPRYSLSVYIFHLPSILLILQDPMRLFFSSAYSFLSNYSECSRFLNVLCVASFTVNAPPVFHDSTVFLLLHFFIPDAASIV